MRKVGEVRLKRRGRVVPIFQDKRGYHWQNGSGLVGPYPAPHLAEAEAKLGG